MKLKDITNNRSVQMIAGGLLLFVVVLFWAYCSAPSTVNVPKGTQNEINANIEKQNATISETQANAIREQRMEANKETTRSKNNLNERKTNYEKVRQAANTRGVDNTNLDARERQLQSDLERLYPANR